MAGVPRVGTPGFVLYGSTNDDAGRPTKWGTPGVVINCL
jgi:hypothetical protein